MNTIKELLILGIESSCDDTSIALLRGDPTNFQCQLLTETSFSQEILLKKWGGVVPEIAARNHLEKIPLLLKETLVKTNIQLNEIDLFAVTTHPGLMGPLLTGINTAKTLSLIYQKPIASINHLYAHLEAIHLTNSIPYPYLGLLVSGGHSIYFLVTSPSQFEILGQTIDDAAGEAFDKGGKILNLGYPAGKLIDELSKSGDDEKYTFPVALLKSKDAQLSFSGIKTALLNFKNSSEFNSAKIEDIVASYQHAIVKALTTKLHLAFSMACEKTKMKTLPIVIGGGVACNLKLRKEILAQFHEAHFVAPHLCTDNASMIAHYALRTFKDHIPYPESLLLDAKGQFVSKAQKLQQERNKK